MPSKRCLSASDWVALGLTLLTKAGPEAVKLEAICAAAELTFGSFYHHVAEHGASMLALARAWHSEAPDAPVDELPPSDPETQAVALTKAAIAIN
ncbi:MAG: hypothetical protein AAF631_13175 [Pseudomonadota bacterium]